ncbi:MAG: hypothetical protein H6734_12005 [Alphaproteobacteria bacterium]|nr:hypothetical protein [Alphaproteobacteria bacterium]
MTFRLPPSLDRSRHTIDDEVAFARSLTPEERLAVVARVCRAAWHVLELNPNRDRILRERDPLPESTRAALARLRSRPGPA